MALYDWLLEAVRQKEVELYSRPGMAPDDPTETARRYGSDHRATDETSSGNPRPDSDFRRVSPAPWVAEY